ncbi:MAG: small basic protein [Planctomycetes bacterium]|nr:small basic protein [Planctomycetota bacterium]
MSTHKSLITRSKLERSRNVLKRIERIELLKERGRWSDGDSVFALPMTRTTFKVRRGKKKDEESKPGAGPAAGAPAASAS